MKPVLDASLFDLEDRLWIMHCARGPAPRAAEEALHAFVRKEPRPWDLDMMKEWAGIPIGLKREAATALGASPDDITLITSTSTALTLVAQGYPWREGDEVLAPLGEFPANAWPWKALERRGVAFREVPLWEGHKAGREAFQSLPPTVEADPESRLLEAIGPHTRLMTVSWTRFQDGLKLDLVRLGEGCRARGVAFVVDGIQAMGTHVPDLRFADAFACGGQKGCLGPQGQAFLWTTPEFRQHILPQGAWMSVEEALDPARPVTDLDRDWLADGRRHECGSLALMTCLSLREGLKTLNTVGIPAVSTHVDRLQAGLLAQLSSLPAWAEEAARLEGLRRAGRLGPMANPFNGTAFQERLAKAPERRIHATAREGYLRIALHGWHTEADLDRLADWLT